DKLQKLKESAPNLTPNQATLAEVKIEPAEYPKYVELAWRQAGFPKAAGAGGGTAAGASPAGGSSAAGSSPTGGPAAGSPPAAGSARSDAAAGARPNAAAPRPGAEPKLPSPQSMLEDIAATVTIREAALTNLANRRAQAVKDWLSGTGGIAGERLFLTAPRIGGRPPGAGDAPAVESTTSEASATPATATQAPAATAVAQAAGAGGAGAAAVSDALQAAGAESAAASAPKPAPAGPGVDLALR
ncbi:MAG: hypothetical protein AB7S98_22110, partial [Burkholderiaceae bacterium]